MLETGILLPPMSLYPNPASGSFFPMSGDPGLAGTGFLPTPRYPHVSSSAPLPMPANPNGIGPRLCRPDLCPRGRRLLYHHSRTAANEESAYKQCQKKIVMIYLRFPMTIPPCIRERYCPFRDDCKNLSVELNMAGKRLLHSFYC
jgi:hypothetical protein